MPSMSSLGQPWGLGVSAILPRSPMPGLPSALSEPSVIAASQRAFWSRLPAPGPRGDSRPPKKLRAVRTRPGRLARRPRSARRGGSLCGGATRRLPCYWRTAIGYLSSTLFCRDLGQLVGTSERREHVVNGIAGLVVAIRPEVPVRVQRLHRRLVAKAALDRLH